MAAANELIAHDRSEEEIRRQIGADWLVYQELDDLCEAAREGNPAIKKFDCSVFDGEYVAGTIDQDYLQKLASNRNDKVKTRRARGADNGTEAGHESTGDGSVNDTNVIDLHNPQ